MRKNLINARQNKNLTQVEVAKMLEVSKRQYQRIETGTSDGSIKIWRKLKSILNAETIDCLLEQEADNINSANE